MPRTKQTARKSTGGKAPRKKVRRNVSRGVRGEGGGRFGTARYRVAGRAVAEFGSAGTTDKRKRSVAPAAPEAVPPPVAPAQIPEPVSPPAGWDDLEKVDTWKFNELVAINLSLIHI